MTRRGVQANWQQLIILGVLLGTGPCPPDEREEFEEVIVATGRVISTAIFGSQCWLVDTPFPLSDIHLVVRTVNTASGQLPNYTMRLWGIGQAFAADWAGPADIIAMQEVREGATSCASGFGKAAPSGVECFARVMAEHGLRSTSWVKTEASGSSQLGLVIGSDWELLSRAGWKLGEDRRSKKTLGLWGGSTRRLIEAKVRHRNKGWVVRIYATHLSHGDDQEDQRIAQITRLQEIIRVQVQPGELPPIVAGDFNITQEGQPDSYEKMSLDFYLANEKAQEVGCFKGGTGVDHIWVGRRSTFTQTRGSFFPLRYHMSPGRVGIDLTSSRTVGPIREYERYIGKLSDVHDSPGISFKVVAEPRRLPSNLAATVGRQPPRRFGRRS